MKKHIKSITITFVSDFAYEILLGLATLVQTGSITQAALVSLGYTAFRHAFKVVFEFLASLIKK